MLRREKNEIEIACLENILNVFEEQKDSSNNFELCEAIVKGTLQSKLKFREEYDEKGFSEEYWNHNI